MSSVYVASAASGLVKIGMSANPDVRVKNVWTREGDGAELVFAMRSARARVVERVAHMLLREHRYHGEWFDVTPQAAIDAVAAAVELVEEGRHEPILAAERPLSELLQVKISPELLRDLDAWRMSHDYPPSRSDVVRDAIAAFIGWRAKE